MLTGQSNGKYLAYTMYAGAAFLLVSLPSVIFAVNPARSLHAYIVYLFGGGVFVLAYKWAQSERYRRYAETFIYVLMAYAVAIAAGGLYQFFALGVIRPGSIVGGVNKFAKYMDLMVPVAVAMLFSGTISTARRILFALASAIMLVGDIVTLSRGSWLALFISVTLLLLLQRRYRVWLLSVLVAGTLVLLNNGIVMRLRTITDMDFSSNAERILAWWSSWEIIKQHPLTGVGFNNFGVVYPQFMLPGAHEYLPHAHNTVLVVATEAGVPAAVTFVVLLLSAGCYIWRGYKYITDPYHAALVIGMSFAMLALMLHGLVDATVSHKGLLEIFFFELGFTLGLIKHYARAAGSHLF